MKKARPIAGVTIAVTIAVLIVASFVVSSRQPSAVNVARRYCAGQGIAPQDLALLGYRGSDSAVGARETVEFQVKGARSTDPPRKLVVDLRRLVYFLPWKVEQMREGSP